MVLSRDLIMDRMDGWKPPVQGIYQLGPELRSLLRLYCLV